MKRNEEMTIIECKYCYNCWKVDTSSSPYRITDPIKLFEQPRDVDLYHLCGVYHKAGIPYRVVEINYENYKEASPYIGVCKNFSDEVCAGIKKGNSVLVAGGYCAHAPAIVGGIQRAIGRDKKIGVVWIDAHSDNRIIESSPMKEVRFVGIPISTILGQTFEAWRIEACGLIDPCEGGNVLASDLRANDEESNKNLLQAGVVHLNSAQFSDPNAWSAAVKKLAGQVDAIYLSVDADILKPEYIPAYAKIVPGGHEIDIVMRNIRIVMETEKVLAYSLFCVDFDRYESGGEWTYLNGMKMIAAGLEQWKQLPDF